MICWDQPLQGRFERIMSMASTPFSAGIIILVLVELLVIEELLSVGKGAK